MTNKRWIAVGMAIVIFVVSLIIPATVKQIVGEREKEPTNFLKDFVGEGTNIKVLEDGDSSSRIAVIDVKGVIMDQQVSPFEIDGYNHGRILSNLDRIKEDESIKAILLRVNSPGGGVYESAELSDKIIEVKEERDIPVYTVMESMAASGGYYIAANSDKIFAQTETITGSIGVIMQGFNVTGLLDKLGVQDRTIKSGNLKDLGSTTRENTDEELQVMQNLVDNMYERFVDTIEMGRDLSREEIYKISDGRIYDGAQALENGLIDELGYYHTALNGLKEDYSLENSQVIHFGKNKLSLFGQPLLKIKQGFSDQLSPLGDININELTPKLMYIYKGV